MWTHDAAYGCDSITYAAAATAVKDDNGKSVPVPGLVLNTADSIRRFARSMSRQKHARQRMESFGASEFKAQEHIQQIESENARIELTSAN